MDRRTHKIKVSTILLWLAMSVQLIGQTGCAPDEQTYSHFEHVTNQVWHHDMPIRFMPTCNDSTTVRDLWLTVRHTQEYPYGNLPIVVDLIGDSGQVTRHRVHLEITDGQGNWLGQGFGTLFQCRAHVASGVTAEQARRVVVWQAVDSCESLPGISDVGILLN